MWLINNVGKSLFKSVIMFLREVYLKYFISVMVKIVVVK